MNEVTDFVKDLGARALHTFWQAFVAGLVVMWAASGLDVSDLVTVASWHKVLVMLLAAAGAAALSTVKGLVKQLRSNKQSIVQLADSGLDAIADIAEKKLDSAEAALADTGYAEPKAQPVN